jgi:hypothetical protein
MSTHEINLSKVSEKVQPLILMAIEVGWMGTQQRNGTVIIHSPVDNRVVLSFAPVRSWNSAKLRTISAKIRKYGDPVKVAILQTKVDEVDEGKAQMADPIISEKLVVSLMDPTKPVVMEDEPAPKPEPPKKEAPPPRIVSERPWAARKGTNARNPERGGRVYDSPTVIERHWSDGTIDFKCTRCDYTNPLPRSVKQHFASSKDTLHTLTPEEAQNQRKTSIDPSYTAPLYHYGTSVEIRSNRLAAELIRAAAAVASDEDLERWLTNLATQVIVTRDEEKSPPEQHGPLTTEQVLERIRRLVDGGEMDALRTELKEANRVNDEAHADYEALKAEHAAQEAEWNEGISEMEANHERIVAMSEEAVRQRDEALSRWQALVELIGEVSEPPPSKDK